VPRGMLLGYIVSQRGIEPNPEKVNPQTDGPDSRPQGGLEGVGVPCRFEPFHFAARRKGVTPLPTPEEA
jgi:hypothetical protein